ncbi:MAG: Trk system potassium transporter TrkA [Deltaproteobacteria bacterium]|nr:Trk system potassium transporter TrkA [Deltaproteobacteria bacterium]MBW1952452.1 Trk system potassium transporter TrkA [Deltaproteobacteria bacterium]MBW1987774.1 Trk system potassium transporter TrkA [Deltaproteobacteria bacterium]MBW2134903.1 Trk system potassium transporter TrkA [Deltaproteobacteria bacterium]
MKIVIVGAGEVGFHIAQRLALENKEVVVIDKNPEALKRVSDHLDVQVLHGSGSDPRVLEVAGIKSAERILAVTDSDEANLIVCFFANFLAPGIPKVARIRSEEYNAYRQALAKEPLNINMVINPDVEVIKSILSYLSAPDVEEINEFAGGRIVMVGKYLQADSPLNDLKLLHLPDKIGGKRLIIAALIRNDQLIIPKGTDRIKAHDLVYFVCEKKDLEKFLKLFGGQVHSLRNILIVGGGKIGLRLAQALDNKNYNTKLIECDLERSQYLSAQLNRIIVLHGDGTDQELLDQENIGSMDMIMALTGDEEMNILSCLLAKRLGAYKTLARINKFAYISLVQTVGIDHIVSTRLAAIYSILHYIRRGRVLSIVSLKGEQAEVLEAIALETSDIVGTPLKELKFPADALVLCILRGEKVIIPTGDSVIQPQDRVMILSTRQNIPLVEKSLMVKLEYF